MAQSQAAAKNTATTMDDSFLSEFAGSGLENITSDSMSMGYLSMVQPGSSAEAAGAKPGVWRNSATGDEYGNIITVCPLAFKTIWNERSEEPPFSTVARYEPHSIEVEVKPPKPGTRGYPTLINPKTGNRIQELFVYAVVLPEHPEAGVLLFNPTIGNMRACKSWNTQLKQQILPNGVKAPIFGYTWNLVCDLVTNPKKPAEKIAQLIKVEKSSLVSKEFFEDYAKPQLASVNSSVLQLTGPEDEDDEE